MAEDTRTSKGSPFWQIYFPAMIAGMILIVIGLLAARGLSGDAASRYAEISTALLVLPLMFFSLIFLAVGALSIYLIQRLIKAVPPITERILDKVDKISQPLNKLSGLVVKPLILPRALVSGILGVLIRKDDRIQVDH